MTKLKQRLKVQLVQQRQQPNFLTTERFNEAVYGNHPAATVAGTPESIDALTSEKLAAWHKARYAPQNTLLGISGDVNAQETIAKLKDWFSKWPTSEFKVSPTPTTTAVKEPHVYVVDRPNSVQTTLAMGNIAIDRTSPDYPAMVVMDQILGAGAAARLFLNLREAKGYTYGVYSSFHRPQICWPVSCRR